VIVIAMAVFEVFDPYLTPPLSSQELAKNIGRTAPGRFAQPSVQLIEDQYGKRLSPREIDTLLLQFREWKL